MHWSCFATGCRGHSCKLHIQLCFPHYETLPFQEEKGCVPPLQLVLHSHICLNPCGYYCSSANRKSLVASFFAFWWRQLSLLLVFISFNNAPANSNISKRPLRLIYCHKHFEVTTSSSPNSGLNRKHEGHPTLYFVLEPGHKDCLEAGLLH